MPVPVPGDTGEVRLRITPDRSAFTRGLQVRAAMMLPLVAVGLVGPSAGDLPAAAVWSVVGAGVLVAVAAVALTISRVEVTATELRTRRVAGLSSSVPLSQVSGSVLAAQYEQYGTAIAPMMTVTGPDRRRVLRLSGQLFAGSDLAALGSVLGNGAVVKEPVTPRMLEERFPGLVPVHERRPFLLATLVVLAIVVVATVIGLSQG